MNVISKHINPDLLESFVLSEAIDSIVTPVMGTILYDSNSEFGRIRDYTTMTMAFPELKAYRIEGALLSAEFVVHRDDDIYVDCSLVFSAMYPVGIEENAAHLAELISQSDPVIVEDFAEFDVVVLHNEGGGTWGHHLIHNIPRILLYLRNFPDGKIVLTKEHNYINSNFGRTLHHYGVEDSQIIGVERKRTYRFKSVTIIDFLYDFQAGMAHPLAIQLLNDIKHLPDSNLESSNNLFVNRIEAKSRAISNITEVSECLGRYNVHCNDVGSRQLGDQIKLWKNARLVVSVLGSDLTNIVFAQPGTKILALSPHWFGDNFFYHLALAKGLQWNELRCGNMTSKNADVRNSSFSVDTSMLSDMLNSLAQ